MKPKRKLIRQIAGRTGTYTIKAKVIKKTNVHSAGGKEPLLYQKITFQDAEGTKMKTILHHDHLELFDDVFEDNMEYDISNVKVIKQTHQLSHLASYRIEFNSATTIQPVNSQEEPDEPGYLPIVAIPRTLLPNTYFDVLGIVVYVDQLGQVPSKAPLHTGHPVYFRDVVIIDNSHAQVLTVTTWDQIAVQESTLMQTIASPFPVVGFTDLRTSFQRGFTLSTTNTTSIIFEPLGDAAVALRDWASKNVSLLQAKKNQISHVRTPQAERTITTIGQLLAKKPNDTLQEEHHWIQVRLENFTGKNLHLYLGCSNCGTGSDIEDVGVPYTCMTCIRESVISTPRMAMTFGASDESGYYTFTALTENAEKLLGVKAATIYSMPAQEKEDTLRHIVKHLHETSFYIQVAPAISLSLTQVLRWVLRKVSHI